MVFKSLAPGPGYDDIGQILCVYLVRLLEFFRGSKNKNPVFRNSYIMSGSSARIHGGPKGVPDLKRIPFVNKFQLFMGTPLYSRG